MRFTIDIVTDQNVDPRVEHIFWILLRDFIMSLDKNIFLKNLWRYHVSSIEVKPSSLETYGESGEMYMQHGLFFRIGANK